MSPIAPISPLAKAAQIRTPRIACLGLPAPKYCPASVAAAMPIAKPGRKLIASIRIAHMCEPNSPEDWPGVDSMTTWSASFTARWATKNTIAKLPTHMPSDSM